jgi:hypothetical protein
MGSGRPDHGRMERPFCRLQCRGLTLTFSLRVFGPSSGVRCFAYVDERFDVVVASIGREDTGALQLKVCR